MTSHANRLMRRTVLAAVPAAAFVALAGPAEARWCGARCDQVVLDWNAGTHQVIKAADGYLNPMGASRTLAMVHLAMHDAVNAVDARYESYALKSAPSSFAQHSTRRRADEGVAAIAAATAAHDVLAALYPQQKSLLQTMLGTALHEAGHGAAIGQGRKLGAEAAAAMVAQRANDGSAAEEAYKPGQRPGEYQFTPGFDFLAAPHWRAVKPFSLAKPSQFRVAPPPALDSADYTAALQEVRLSGSSQPGARRSAIESQYAAFWYEFSDAG
jgi:hypothetical protein